CCKSHYRCGCIGPYQAACSKQCRSEVSSRHHDCIGHLLVLDYFQDWLARRPARFSVIRGLLELVLLPDHIGGAVVRCRPMLLLDSFDELDSLFLGLYRHDMADKSGFLDDDLSRAMASYRAI